MGLDLNNLPILISFKGLKKGDTVYSIKYGLGTVQSLYKNDEIIVAFTNLRKRCSVVENEIRKIPLEMQIRRRCKVEIMVDGVNMTLKELKKKNKMEKKLAEFDKKQKKL